MRTRLAAQAGFTLIELLVTVMIIGILSAIALPMFLGQTTKAGDATLKTFARTAYEAAATLQAAEDAYPTAPADLVAVEPTLAEAHDLAVTRSGTSVRVSVESESGTRSFWYDLSDSGAATRGCSPVASGACSDTGTW